MKKSYLFLFICLIPILSFAQDDAEQQKFGIKFSGFVKNDFFFDTRQTIAAREGHFLLFPSPQNLDVDNNDINAKSNFNFLAIQSRLSGNISGPDAFGAKTSGLIEGDFFAQADDNTNLLRLRHAFVKLNWTNTELVFGQSWNPMFVTGCFPGTVSFNTGAPFQPFARNPQIRLTQTQGALKIIAAALSQRDYVSRGPGGNHSGYLRNSAMPDMHLQLHFGDSKSVLVGAGGAYKSIVPRLATENGYQANEKLGGMSLIGFAAIKTAPLTIKVEGVFGENICDVLSVGGFAEKSIDATTDRREYTPYQTMSVWTDIHTNGKEVQFGVFGGYTKNMGTKDDIVGNSYGLLTGLESQMRVSPRVIFNSGKTRIAGELEYTAAKYGTAFNSKGVATETSEVANLRLLLAVYYFF